VRRFPCPLTSAAVSAAPGYCSCLKLAGPQTVLQGLWARARRAARNNSPSTAPAPRPRSVLQTSQPAQLESGQKLAEWGWAPPYKQQGTPGHSPSLGMSHFVSRLCCPAAILPHVCPTNSSPNHHHELKVLPLSEEAVSEPSVFISRVLRAKKRLEPNDKKATLICGKMFGGNRESCSICWPCLVLLVCAFQPEHHARTRNYSVPGVAEFLLTGTGSAGERQSPWHLL